MNSATRGTAMVETAIVLSMVLVILFGTMQIAIWGYSQATTEGAAFIGAHAASINSSGTASTDQTYGLSVVNVAFPSVSTSGPFKFNLTYPAQPNAVQAIVTNDAVDALLLVPHANPYVEVRGGDIEPILADNANTLSTNGGVGVQATLTNYCFYQNANKTNCTSAPSIYIAQYDDIYGKGNGKNGQFAEWNCRPGLFPAWGSTYFPTTYPAGVGGYKTVYDPGSTAFSSDSTGDGPLYSFDSQPNQWGKQASC